MRNCFSTDLDGMKREERVLGRLNAAGGICDDSPTPAHASSEVSGALDILCHTAILHIPDRNIIAVAITFSDGS